MTGCQIANIQVQRETNEMSIKNEVLHFVPAHGDNNGNGICSMGFPQKIC